MSELKTFRIREVEDGCPFWQAEYEVYSRDEVNKVIAEKDKKFAKLKGKLAEQATLRVWAELQLRHNKYKRCLAMAKWCFTRSNYFFVVGRSEGGRFAKERFRRSDLYSKWRQRWLELADKFKEAKCR